MSTRARALKFRRVVFSNEITSGRRRLVNEAEGGVVRVVTYALYGCTLCGLISFFDTTYIQIVVVKRVIYHIAKICIILIVNKRRVKF